MAVSYTPGLKVSTAMPHSVRRMLPIEGDVLVKVGDRVDAQDPIARAFMPGDIYPVNLASILGVSSGDIPGAMKVSEGDAVTEGQLIAETKGIFGFFRGEYKSRYNGTVESVSAVTGQLIMRGKPRPIEVKAFLAGTITEVLPNSGVIIEAEVSYIQGIFGIGSENYGPIRVACENPEDDLTEDKISPDMRGSVIVGGARMTGSAVRRAMEVGAAAVISGGMDDQDLKEILGYDLGVAVTGSEPIDTTIIITEGFGDIAMARRTHKLLVDREGTETAVNGATQIRAGVMRPEIVIPLVTDATAGHTESVHVAGELTVGTPVRIIRDPYFGLLGSVDRMPPEPQVLDSGSKARVLDVKLDSGGVATVPRANVEILGG